MKTLLLVIAVVLTVGCAAPTTYQVAPSATYYAPLTVEEVSKRGR